MKQFHSVLDAVWALDIDPTSKLVALRLARHWPHIFPGLKSIAKACCVDERTVRRALRRLEADGVIRVTHRPQRSSVYEFVGVSIPALGGKPPLDLDSPDPTPPPGGTPPVGGGTSPPDPGGMAPADLQPLDLQTDQPSERERARELLPHEKAEARKTLEPPSGTRPVGLYEFREGWKPKESHRAYGRELGLTDAEMLERAEHCKLKLYDHPFPNEDKQFRRELLWLRNDKQTRQARENRKANPNGFNENPGARRRAGDAAPDPIFGPGAGRKRAG